MKLIIAGGRTYRLTPRDFARLDRLHEKYRFTELVNGGAIGADYDARQWTKSRNIPVKCMNANWQEYGRSAGHIRNREMAIYAHDGAVVLFPGGKGTRSMFQIARFYGLKIFDWRFREKGRSND